MPKSKGTSFLIVVNCCESLSCSMPSRKYSPTLPDISSDFSMILSTVPYLESQLTAVLGPTLFTPGMLSEVSPTKAK